MNQAGLQAFFCISWHFFKGSSYGFKGVFQVQILNSVRKKVVQCRFRVGAKIKYDAELL